MSDALRTTAIVGFCLVLTHNSLAVSVDLSGHVYEGDVRDVVGPLAGVTVSLYVSNDAMVMGVQAISTTTDREGSYHLHLRDSGASEYFNIVQTNQAGFFSVRSATVGGSCVSSDWIRYSLEQLMTGLTADNDFYDRRENRPPSASDDSAATVMDTAVAIAVLTNDTDPDGDSLTIIEVTDPPHGTAVYSRQSVTYTPDTGYIGRDSFSYTLSDGRGGVDDATVTVAVGAANQPPAAGDDSASVMEGGVVTINVLSNDSDADGDPLLICEVSDPAHGSTTHDGQTVAYAPDAGFTGTDTFSYVVSDGRGGTDGATVTVMVSAAIPFTGEIRGMVFHDLDADGEMRPGESGLAGWMVFLDDDWDRVAGDFEQKVWTDALGRFVFSGLNPGAYRVDQAMKEGWQQVWPLDSRGEPVAWIVTVEAGQIVQANFGNIQAGSIPGNEEGRLELVAGPGVEHVSPHEVVIVWQTNVESTGIIHYGPDAGLYPHPAEDPVWATVHRLALGDLSPSTMYHFVLTYTGRAGDPLRTRDALFETLPEPDRSPPSLTLDAPGWPAGVVIVSAQAEDDTGVDRVAFFLDDDQILIDYSPPYEAPVDTTQYANGPHSIAVRAHDRAGHETVISQDMNINNRVEAMGPSVRITSHKTGDSVSGEIQITADVNDDKGLWKAELYVDGNLSQQEVFGGPTPPTKAQVQFTLDTRQVSKEIVNDPHDIAVQAWDTAYQDGAHAIRLYVNNVTPTPQYPWLKVIGHTASRIQNRFAISLVVRNQGTQTAHDVVIRSGLAGFQAISGGSAQGQWVGRYDPKGRSGYCEIHSGDIPASAQRTYTYYAVPVLQHPSGPTPKIGHFIYLDYSGPQPAGQNYHASDAWPIQQVASSTGPGGLQQSHQAAVGVCDYLIVTNPYRLYGVFNPSFYQGPTQATADVDGALSLMAELAFHKQGALGYNDQYDVASLVQLIHVGGAWSSRLAGGWASNGYLLIVGEIEIVPAQARKFTYEYTGGEQVWDFVSDYRYASTSGDEEWPELSIGRIIGNSAAALGTALQTSLGGKAFDRSHSLLVSGHPGTGYNVIDFQSWVDGALAYLSAQFVPPLSAQTVLDQPTTAKLFANMADQDVIFLAGHGNAGSWNGTTTADVQGQANLFGTTSPFVFAHACKTGRYVGTYCLAEAFLDAGAAVYLGATDSAGWGQYSNSFFNLWALGESVGLAVKKTKQGIGDSLEDRLWSQTYHVFGDPKFGAAGIPMMQIANPKNVTLCSADGNESGPIDVEIGDYETREVNGQVYLTLPGGQVLSIPDMPLVPYVTIRRSYPRDTQIQQVLLKELSEPVVTTGVELALATGALPGTGSGAMTAAAEPLWWPDKLFEWKVHETPTEMVLALSVYPVRYDSQAREVRFHKRLSFTVEAMAGDVQITDMTAEDIVAQPGASVYVDFLLAGAGPAADTVVQTVVLDAMTDEVRAGLPLRCLHALQGRATYASLWDTTGVPPGTYVLRAELRSPDGLLLDSSVRTVELGLHDCRVSDLTAAPQSVRPGQTITIDAVIRSSGTLPISGTGFVCIDDGAGARLASFADEIAGLTPGEAMPLRRTWTAPAAGAYTVMCYVLYEGKATEPVSLTLEIGD